jgi:hypothetical protein
MMIKGSLTPDEKNMVQAQIKQDIAISTQFEHERHSTHKRGSYSIFTKESHPQAYIYLSKLPRAQLYIS